MTLLLLEEFVTSTFVTQSTSETNIARLMDTLAEKSVSSDTNIFTAQCQTGETSFHRNQQIPEGIIEIFNFDRFFTRGIIREK